MNKKKTSVVQVAFASWIGTSIEWYDFYLYGTAAALVFNKLFFPNYDPIIGQLAAFATFWIGFIARPLGGVVFGHFGDRVGRKEILVLTLALMGLSTFAIGLLPTYDVIGIWATILLVVLRFLQGIAVGGEWGGAVLITTEHAPHGKKGFYGSWPQMGVPTGLLLSSLAFSGASWFYPQQQFLDIGWRIPFLLSALLVIIGAFIRLKIEETPDFERVKQEQAVVKMPVIAVLRSDWYRVMLACGILIATSSSFYIFTTFIVFYGSEVLKLPNSLFLNAILISAFAKMLAIPTAGILSDRFGRWAICLIGCGMLALSIFPIFWLIDTRNPALIILALCIALFWLGIGYGPIAAFFTELFNANVRYSGASLGYQTSGILAGGLAPIIATTLLGTFGHVSWPIGLYLVGITLISLLSIWLAGRAVHSTQKKVPVPVTVIKHKVFQNQ